MRKCAWKQRGELLQLENGAGAWPLISSGCENFCLNFQRVLVLKICTKKSALANIVGFVFV